MVRPLERTSLIDGNRTLPSLSKSWSDLNALPSSTRLNSSSSQCRASNGIQGRTEVPRLVTTSTASTIFSALYGPAPSRGPFHRSVRLDELHTA